METKLQVFYNEESIHKIKYGYWNPCICPSWRIAGEYMFVRYRALDSCVKCKTF